MVHLFKYLWLTESLSCPPLLVIHSKAAWTEQKTNWEAKVSESSDGRLKLLCSFPGSWWGRSSSSCRRLASPTWASSTRSNSGIRSNSSLKFKRKTPVNTEPVWSVALDWCHGNSCILCCYCSIGYSTRHVIKRPWVWIPVDVGLFLFFSFSVVCPS